MVSVNQRVSSSRGRDENETEAEDNYSEHPAKIVRKPVRPFNRAVINETNLDLTPSFVLTQKQLLSTNIMKAKNNQAFYMSMIKGKEMHTDVTVSHDYQELADEEYLLLKDVFLKSNIEQNSLERQKQTLEDQESHWKVSRSATASHEPRKG